MANPEEQFPWPARPRANAGTAVSAKQEIAFEGYALKIAFAGANPAAEIEGRRQKTTTVNYFTGSDAGKWQTEVPTFEQVSYVDLYPGIDLAYQGQNGRLKYQFIVSPGADPGAIKLVYQGADALVVDGDGNLVINTPWGDLLDEKPFSYQVSGDRLIEVSASFAAEGNTVNFILGEYDQNLPLVIDPGLVYSTFLGGSGFDISYSIAVDAGGCVYVSGHTWSDDFPTTAGAYDSSFNEGYECDVFVAKFSPCGSELIYATFLGGSDEDWSYSIAVDAEGCTYVTGETGSHDFPTTQEAYDNLHHGSYDAFVAKFNPHGSDLVYSTYLGGTDFDSGYSIAVDAAGCAYITGTTESSDFPTTAGVYDNTYNGSWDVFIAKLKADGSDLLYSTFLGGSDHDYGQSIAVDAAGCAYVTGETRSSNFPASSGAYDTSLNGDIDVFISKLDQNGSELVYSTYLGGSDINQGFSIAVDDSGYAYVTGRTSSPDFPVLPLAYDAVHNGYYDAFVAKLNSEGSGLAYSTFLGGSSGDIGSSIALDADGCAYVTGWTSSATFPTTADAYDTTYNTIEYGCDVFVTKLNSLGSSLLYSTFLGGNKYDYGNGIVIDASGNAYVTGDTDSSDFPTTPGAYDTVHHGRSKVYVAKLGPFEPDQGTHKDLKIAVIMSKPEDMPLLNTDRQRDYYESIAETVRQYYDEASYGTLAITTIDIYDNDCEWYRVPGSAEDYTGGFEPRIVGTSYNSNFLKASLEAADGDVSYSNYDIVMVLGGGLRGRGQYGFFEVSPPWPGEEYVTSSGDVARRPIRIYEHHSERTWAHEIGHALGDYLGDRFLPDLYPYGFPGYVFAGFEGDIGNWGLMGDTRERWPVHPCSWTKERLGWLRYRDIELSDDSEWVSSLPNLQYGDEIPRRGTSGWLVDDYFVFEARSADKRYSRWDYDIPVDHKGGLVLYKYYDPPIGIATLNVVSNPNTGRQYFLPGDEYWFEPPSYHPRSGIPRPGVLLSVLSEQALEHAYEIEIKLQRTAKNGGTTAADNEIQVQGTCSWKNTIIARLEPISQWWSEGAGVLEPPPEQFALPDLDLHAYTPDGKHVGMNYETGIFEMQIPGVIASGGFYNSSEWISVPEESAAYFVISSRPTALFLEEHPDLPPENEEGLYALSVSYFDENLDGVGSGLEELTIAPGAEVFHLVEIRLMPDGNYQLEIREGLDLMSLEAWEAAVDNIPDELFINNPSQRKGALKNKLRAIFAKVKKKNYHGVINQIQNDLLKKLNADGKADWVKEPVLVDELGALTAMLKYKWR